MSNPLKTLLLTILVEEPPKRINGSSAWKSDLALELKKQGLITGEIIPCCDDMCGNNEPCAWVYKGDTDKELTDLINKTFK